MRNSMAELRALKEERDRQMQEAKELATMETKAAKAKKLTKKK